MGTLSRVSHYIRIAKNLSWPLLLTSVIKKTGFQPRWVRQTHFLSSAHAKRPSKTLEILSESMRATNLSLSTILERMEGSSVLEVGCGQHIGFAPFCIGSGAKSYTGVDPALDAELFQSKKILNNYLIPSFVAARRFSSQENSFKNLNFKSYTEENVREALSLMDFKDIGIDELNQKTTKFDICISISCFEHILNFKTAAKVLAEISHEETIHVHVVNFSNHLSKQEPFQGLYEMPYEKFGELWHHNINGLRLSDMKREFDGAQMPLKVRILDKRPDALPANIHSSWLKSYTRDELSVRTAIFTSL